MDDDDDDRTADEVMLASGVVTGSPTTSVLTCALATTSVLMSGDATGRAAVMDPTRLVAATFLPACENLKTASVSKYI